MLSLRLRVLTPLDSAGWYTPWSVFQDGTINLVLPAPGEESRRLQLRQPPEPLLGSDPNNHPNLHRTTRLAAFPMSLRLESIAG